MKLEKSDLQANLDTVRAAMANSARKSNRTPEDICLVVVTKKQPAVKIQALFDLGVKDIGENYPEETILKSMELSQPAGVHWHMIGHLQSRKAPIVAEHFSVIHSIDKLDTASKLSQLLEGSHTPAMRTFVEVNIAGEDTKFGIPAWDKSQWDDIARFFAQINDLPKLELLGLMVMPPLFRDPEQGRPFFAKARLLLDYVTRISGLKLADLSMGTSSDYQIAIEEGATVVRIGTAITGPRIA
jgi:pyridoxal phosphate enzyme (YggS family)